jgi:dihydropteroate synthase
MGIINVNDNSFHEGSRANSIESALHLAEKHIIGGATFLDLGASTSKPGALISNPKEEWDRLAPVLKSIRVKFPHVFLSIDTYHSEVAQLAVSEGADLINDISAGAIDSQMFDTVASLQVPYVIMHMQGTPAEMQKNPHYQDVTQEVIGEMATKVKQLFQLGASDVIIDPGFGFGKTLEHNYTLLNNSTDDITIGITGNNGKIIWFRKNGIQFYGNGTTLLFDASSAGTMGLTYKIAFVYGQSDFRLYINGVSSGTSTSGTFTGTFDDFTFFPVGGVPYTNANKINEMIFFPNKLTNAELASLTTI